MKDRKVIAIVMSHIVADYASETLDGIITQAKVLGYDVAVFSLFSLSDELTHHQYGEENIYNLINFDKVSGVIFCDIYIWALEMKDRIGNVLSTRIDPDKIICINSNNPRQFRNILQNESRSFAAIVDHVIEKHGKKKICCLTGTKGNRIAEERLEGYRQSMKAHLLDIPDEYIVYGDFWKNSACDLAADIAEGRIEKPEAVVCASDIMAISLCSALYERGIIVPDDIIITGYDASYDAYENNPSITTVSASTKYIGAKSVCELHEILTGERVEPQASEEITFVTGLSCGCGKDIDYMMKYNNKVSAERNVNDIFQNSIMLEELTDCDNLHDCIMVILGHIYLLDTDIKEIALCLGGSWNRFSEGDDEYIRDGYDNDMYVRMKYSKENGVSVEEKFDVRDMFPPFMLEKDEPVCCYFYPLHFGERCFGYMVFKYTRDYECAGNILRLWIKNVNTALEYLRVRERMNIINNRMYISSIRDCLTGIYNRQGYKIFAGEIFEKAKSEHKRLLLIVADLDRLKYINDTFGHSEGDNAITMAAQAIQSCDGNGEKCFRTGGDEYVVLGCGHYSDEMADYCIQRIRGYLRRYNETSDKEYDVEASIGIFFDYTDGYSDIDECYEIADKLMYDDKLARRKNRTD